MDKIGVGILSCLLLFSATDKLVVRAFVSSSRPSRISQSAASLTQFLGLDDAVAPWIISRKSTSRLSVSLEEDIDLDAALDGILAQNTQRRERSFLKTDEDKSEHMKGSHPISPVLVEEDDPIDFRDTEILNTKNPRWIKAGLSPEVIDVLSEKGITHFTPVQAEAFAPVLAGRDVIGRSRTGTGKTLAFGIPAMTRLLELADKKGTRVGGRMQRGRSVSMLVLCPTRELAKQVQEELALIARPLGLFTTVFHGGVSYDPQRRAIQQGLDVLVGTPGRVIDHIQRGTLDLSDCDIVVLDEADEMLNMGFAEDVETILEGHGSNNKEKSQCLLFSATTPPWVKDIGRKYQKDALSIDSTGEEGGARVATTVRHLAVQLPPGFDAKKAVLEDIIAVEISKDTVPEDDENEDLASHNPIAAAAKAKKNKSAQAVQQKIFGKTIVFTQTKKEADDLVSSGVFKSLTAQAIHGDVGQAQREATLSAFRKGAFNVLVATDVAARGIDIQDVDLVVQLDPPRDVDTYVHRSGRTGRAGSKGVSVLLFSNSQARDIVKIERSLGHGFKFDLVGPPSTEAALRAAAKTSAIACMSIPDETASYFKEAAASLLADGQNEPEDIIARCLAAISKRTTKLESRSLLTGETGKATVEMSYAGQAGRFVKPGDVMFTVGKLSRMSRSDEDLTFESDIGKILSEDNSAVFDMSVEDAKKLVEFSKDIDAGGAVFSIKHARDIKRDRFFGQGGNYGNSRGPRSYGGRGGGGYRPGNDRFDSGGRRPYNARTGPGYERQHNNSRRDFNGSPGDGNRRPYDANRRPYDANRRPYDANRRPSGGPNGRRDFNGGAAGRSRFNDRPPRRDNSGGW